MSYIILYPAEEALFSRGWKDQNIDSSFSRQRKPSNGEGVVQLANRIAVWRQSEVSIDF